MLLLVAGVLNIIWGIAAIGDSKFFTASATYIISGLHTWGWITLILGVLELIAAFSPALKATLGNALQGAQGGPPGAQQAASAAQAVSASGCPASAPRWAITSLPRSVAAATTALAPVCAISPARTRAHASGAYPLSRPGSTTCRRRRAAC